MLKNCESFTNCIRKLNNAQVGSTKDIDVVMPMYDLKNIAIKNTQKHQEVYFNMIEMRQLMIYKVPNNLNPRLEYYEKTLLMVIQRMLK